MFHGLLSSKEALSYYQKNLDYLYDEILCYDLPGHGENLMKFNTINVQKFVVGLYDQLSKKFDEIDVLGYSMGGVIACYLQSVRRVHKMILLAPAYRYLNFNNYHFQAFKTNKNERSAKRNYFNLIRFTKIISDLSDEFQIIYPETLIIWGNEDFLVKEESGHLLYEMVRNKNRQFIILSNHNHFNIVASATVLNIIYDFIS